MHRRIPALLAAGALLTALCACSGQNASTAVPTAPAADTDPVGTTAAADGVLAESETMTIEINEATVPLAASAPVSGALMPVASGTQTSGNEKAVIDYSNAADGYVMIQYLAGGTARVKVLVTGPSGTTYTYNLNNTGTYETFPLSDGDGSYQIGVYQNVSGTKYATVCSASLQVTLTDEFAPFLLPNQYVNYTADGQVVKTAATLTAGCTDTLSKITAVYNYVIQNFSYDRELAATVQSGYLPDLEQDLKTKKGICFDYAALMTAMLRSQGVPTKLVVGYAGTAYHAWISTWSDTDGWVDAQIYFDGSAWKLMDPTFASTGNSSAEILKYIGDGANYIAKYLY